MLSHVKQCSILLPSIKIFIIVILSLFILLVNELVVFLQQVCDVV